MAAADYTDKYLQMLEKVTSKGADVSFDEGKAESTFDPLTDTFTGHATAPPTAVTGKAVEIPGDPEEYAVLQLIAQSPATLLFVPDRMGQTPADNSICLWGGVLRSVKQVFPIRPAGTVIGARVICV
jgi:hypothetical protein